MSDLNLELEEIIERLDSCGYLSRDVSQEDDFDRVYHLYDNVVGALGPKFRSTLVVTKGYRKPIFFCEHINYGDFMKFENILMSCTESLQIKMIFDIDIFRMAR